MVPSPQSSAISPLNDLPQGIHPKNSPTLPMCSRGHLPAPLRPSRICRKFVPNFAAHRRHRCGHLSHDFHLLGTFHCALDYLGTPVKFLGLNMYGNVRYLKQRNKWNKDLKFNSLNIRSKGSFTSFGREPCLHTGTVFRSLGVIPVSPVDQLWVRLECWTESVLMIFFVPDCDFCILLCVLSSFDRLAIHIVLQWHVWCFQQARISYAYPGAEGCKNKRR